jgi:hypothetical protein
MAYKNRFIDLTFPELSEDDDKIWVKIRNPRIMPPAELVRRPIKKLDDGEDDPADTILATCELFAKLIVGWHVYDGMDNDDNPAALGLPATGLLVRKVPTEILGRLGEELAKINPRMRTEDQEATTSNP